MPLETALTVALGVARALAAAHARDIVHRDVKPSNVLVGDDGAIRLTDFGIARCPTRPGARHTFSFGTPAYMSPEARAGAPPDPRSDLWALGVVLHEMLTGNRPAEGPDGEVKVELDHDGSDPRWTDVERMLRALLSVDRDVRPSDVRPAVADLESLIGGRPDERPGRTRHRVASGAVVGAVGLAVFALLRDGEPPPLPPAEEGSRGHVLWVDDDPALSLAEEDVLVRAGFRVSRARSTEAALAAFDPGVHDLVVSDLGRVESSGYRVEAGLELLRGLRARDPDARVIFFTSSRALEVIRAAPVGARAFGMTDSSTEFYRLVEQAAEASRSPP